MPSARSYHPEGQAQKRERAECNEPPPPSDLPPAHPSEQVTYSKSTGRPSRHNEGGEHGAKQAREMARPSPSLENGVASYGQRDHPGPTQHVGDGEEGEQRPRVKHGVLWPGADSVLIGQPRLDDRFVTVRQRRHIAGQSIALLRVMSTPTRDAVHQHRDAAALSTEGTLVTTSARSSPGDESAQGTRGAPLVPQGGTPFCERGQSVVWLLSSQRNIRND